MNDPVHFLTGSIWAVWLLAIGLVGGCTLAPSPPYFEAGTRMDVSAEALISEVTAGDAGPVFFEIVGSRDLPSVLITMKELGFECSQNQCFYSRLSSPEGFGADYVDVVFLSVRFQSDPVRSARDIRAHYFANRLNRLKPTLENEGKPYVRRMED